MIDVVKSNRYGLPLFSETAWNEIKKEKDKKEVIEFLVNYIINNNIGFPMNKIGYYTMMNKFYDLRSKCLEDFRDNIMNVNENVYCKRDYNHKFEEEGLAVLNFSSEYNDISNYYHQSARLNCGSSKFEAPLKVWGNKEKMLKANWPFWREKIIQEINDGAWKTFFRIGMYIAAQFKPNVVKFLYELVGARNIIDFSCGWGDRLAAFYCSKNTERYYGSDPNETVFELYKKQCYDYECFLGRKPKLIEYDDYFECKGEKNVLIFNSPAEDIDWNNKVDFVFTSPPYFSSERYNEGGEKENNQSWKRYNELDNWKNNFLFKVLKNIKRNLDGYMFINIIDTIVKDKRLLICDDMVEFCKNEGLDYLGQMGLRLNPRPNIGIKNGMSKIYIENIWLFSSKNKNYDILLKDRINGLKNNKIYTDCNNNYF
jgi:hypothetical protein